MDTKLSKRVIIVVRHGSHAYGLNTPTSDLDIKGVLVAPPEHYFGFLGRVEQVEEKDPNDLVIYEITKFFKLASDCNPNIIEVLHVDDSDVLFSNPLGNWLRAVADIFLSQKAMFTFSGYAHAQLKRMKNHHEWMKNPPTQPGPRENWALPHNKNWCDGIEAAYVQGQKIELTAEQDKQWEREKLWRDATRKWANYQEWLAGRNPKRHELEAKFGYDTKHGMHLVRLLRMGKEIMETGKVIVKRPDREELLAIRNNGIWDYEKIVEYAEKMDAELQAYYASKASPLPHSPDRNKLNAICMAMVDQALRGVDAKVWDGKI